MLYPYAMTKETTEEKKAAKTMGQENFWPCFLVLLWAVLRYAGAGWIGGVCVNFTEPSNQPPRPKLSSQFEVIVQCNMLDRNQTILVHEYYDYEANIAHITQVDFEQTGDFYYDYANNELLQMDRTNGGCTVTTLSSNRNKFLFGMRSSGVQGHIFAAENALSFGDTPERYVGRDVVRGIEVEAWNSCQYSPVLDATMNVTWYFSAKTAWDMDIGQRSVPIRAVVVGKIKDSGLVRSFSHIYDFFAFRFAVDPQDLQLKSGDYCPGRLNKVPFPKLPNVFSITGERIDFSNEQMTTIEERYDQTHKLNVYRYRSADSMGTMRGINDVTEVNDFNSGIAYIINTATGSCQMVNVTQGRFQYAYVTGSTNDVRQQTPAEFFLLNGMNYSYGGVKVHRGIKCDTWIGGGINSDNSNIRQEWYFAAKDYQNWANMQLELYQIPILFRQWDSLDENSPTYQFNAFSFDLDRPLIATLDVSACFHGAQRANIRFSVDGKFKAAVTYNIENFKAAIRDAVSIFLGVSVLQVSDIKVYTGGQDIPVSLDLLDTPPAAQDIGSMIPVNSLRNALSFLFSASVQSNFQFSVVLGDSVINIKPLNNSGRIFFSNGTCLGCDSATNSTIKSTISYAISSGYSGGALGGLALAMLVVGGGLGAAGGFFFGRQGLPSQSIATLQDMMKK